MNLILMALVVALAGDGANTAADRAALERQCCDLAERIEKSMNAGDSSVLEAAIDQDAIGEAATRDIDADPKYLLDFREGSKSSIRFGNSVKNSVAKEGSYKFLRVRWVGDEPRALFRLITGGGCNYHELFLTRMKDGSIRSRDVYVYAIGETLSETVRRGAVQAAAESKMSLLDRLMGARRELTDSLEQRGAFFRQFQTGAYDEALASYHALPESVRHEKAIMVAMIMAKFHANPSEYRKAIEEFERLFPNDPAVDLMAIDGFFERKDWKGLHRCIDRLDERLGGDAWLAFIRGNAFMVEGEMSKATAALNRAIETEPTLLNPHWSLVSISLTEKNHAETARLLERLEKEHNVSVREDLEEIAEYADFVKSDEYRAWRASHPKKE